MVHANTLVDDLQALLDQDSKITLEVLAFSVLYHPESHVTPHI